MSMRTAAGTGAPTTPVLLPAAGSTARRRVRTRTVAVVAWAACVAALATELYPTPAAALFAFLAGAVLVVTLRTSLRGGLAAAVAAAGAFAFADLQPNAAGGAGTSGETLASISLGLGLLLVSPAVAEAASAAISRVPADPAWTGHAGGPIWIERATMTERDAGLRRAEWEVARAVEYGREVALALIGLDVAPGGDEAAALPGLMRGMDELVLDSVTRFDLVCEFGPRERLLVLPEESAANLVDGASQICALAGERMGRGVRMVLAGCPAHGSTLGELLADLEHGLNACRVHGVTVQVSRTARPHPGGTEPLLVAVSAPGRQRAV